MAANGPILSAVATSGSRISNLSIKDGQLVFVQDLHRIALDFDGKRVFYNQIIELQTDEDRLGLLAPVSGLYYFVIGTAILWTYKDTWIQITTPPRELINFDTVHPKLGNEKTLYVNKLGRNIAIWDSETSKYITIADTVDEASADDISALFT